MVTKNFVIGFYTDRSGFVDDHNHPKQVIEMGRSTKSNLTTKHRKEKAILLKRFIRATDGIKKLDSGDFEPSQVIRMVDNSHLVGLTISNPNLNACRKHDRPLHDQGKLGNESLLCP
jgi:hypothetical protein